MDQQRKKRRLNYEKCIFCRKDKKKCEPTGRTWPGQKCDRCAEMDLACSDNQRTRGKRTSLIGQPEPGREPSPERPRVTDSGLMTGNGSVDIWTRKAYYIRYLKRVRDSVNTLYRLYEDPDENPPRLYDALFSLLSGVICEMNDSLSSPEKLHYGLEIASLLFSETSIPDDVFRICVEEGDASPLDPARRLVQQSIARGHLGHAIQLQESVLSWCARAFCYTPTQEDAETEIWRSELLTYKTIHDRLLQEVERYTDIAAPGVDFLPIPSDISAFITMSVRSRLFLKSTDVLGRSLLHVAVACKHVDALKLIDISTMISHQDLFGMTPLHVACMCGNVDAVQALLSSGASVSLESKAGEEEWLPWHFAAASGNCVVIEKLAHILLEKGLDINAQTMTGQTAISLATEKGHEKAIRLLINLGANPKIADINGRNSLHCAILWQHPDVAACLLQHYGGNLNVPDTSGEHPLHVALWRWIGNRIEDRRRIVQLLLSHITTDPNATNSRGDTALHIAVRDRYKAEVELLLSCHAVSRSIKNVDGKTPLFVAAEDGSEAMVELLLGCEGVETEVEDNNGETPLSIAIERGHITVARLIQRFQKARRAAQIGTSTGPDRIEDRTGHEDLLVMPF